MALLDLLNGDVLADAGGAPVEWTALVAGAAADAVLLDAAVKPEELAPYVAQLRLVVVPFPKFRDGRGFTLGRVLRERYGFAGVVRAVGHLIPDQVEALIRTGFDQLELKDGVDAARFVASVKRYHVQYQPGVADQGFALRRVV